MTRIQQVLWELESDYYGHPYFVTGNALYNAFVRRLDGSKRRDLAVSMGVFVPGAVGAYPEAHSETGGSPYIGTNLHSVDTYADLWLFRDPTHPWLSDSRPREAINTHDLQSHGGRQAFAPATRFGLPDERRSSKRTVTWHLQAHLHASGERSILPLPDEILGGLQVGGGRNYGFGQLALVESQCVDLDDLDYTRLKDDDDLVIELVSPYVLESSDPAADDQSVPWWWGGDGDSLRHREERLVGDNEIHELRTVDHGQVVRYTGSDPVRTAKNGVLGVGTHSKFGYGEFRLRPAGDSGVVPSHGHELGGVA